MARPRTTRDALRAAAVPAAAAALFFARMRVRVDPDLFFHLYDGGRLATRGILPLVEQGSFTRAGKSIVAIEWLASGIFYALFRAGGYAAVCVLAAALTGGALYFLGRVLDDDGLPAEARALLQALAAFGFASFALAKVQNFTFFFFALFLWWARLWERGRRWTPWAMAGALAVWVNLHGGFMLGWVLLGCLCARDFLGSRRAIDLAPWAAGTFACFLHPDGARGFAYPLWFLFAAPPGRAMITEWKRPGLELSTLPYWLIGAAALAARPWRHKGKLPWGLMALAFLVLGLRARKMLPFFTMTGCAAAGLGATGGRWSRARTRAALFGAGAALAGLLAVVVADARSLAPLGPASDFERQYPRVALEHLLAAAPDRRLFHAYDWGAYLLYKNPDGQVFIDGRLDPYWTLIDDYRAMIGAAPGWRELFAAYGIGAALIPPQGPLARALSADPDWKGLGTDGRAAVFVRREAPPVPVR